MQFLSELRNQQIADRRRQAEQHNEASELGVTSRWVLERLKDNVDLAQDAGQFGAANSSLKLIADLIGMKAGDNSKPAEAQPALPGDRLDEFARALNDLDLGDIDDGQFMLDELDASDDEALQQALSEIPEDDPEDLPFLNPGEDK
ncbi:hypothetical protein GXC69_11970 [Candidatus Macondimonas diazotrophica]|nr:hypothetical protein [Candidatus Macondimonas diazotrophica]